MTKFFKNALEIVAWFSIFLFPTAILAFIGYVIYANNKTALGLILLTLLSLVGIVVGIYIAERVRKSIGCSTVIFRAFTSHDVTKWVSGEDSESTKDKEKKAKK